MENLIRAMMDLIASEVCGKPLDKSQYVFTDEELAGLYKLSKSHDLAHLVGDALIKNNLVKNDEVKAKFQKQIMLALYRYEKMNYELGRLRTVLNEAQIPFIPLKGAVMRQYYPEPWMRTSCDIDILVHDEQVDEAAQVIVRRLGYNYEKKNYHDISLMSDSRVHLELHHSIKENKANIDVLLAEYRRYTVPFEGYEYQFTNEFFLFHQLAHASYHFLGGGCGVRPFLDIFILERKVSFDRGTLDKMLYETGIKKFSEEASKLANVWFGDGKHDNITRRMENFIIEGGVYGNIENSVAVEQQREKGKFGYIFHNMWLPYELLCINYPRLRGHRILQPFYEIRRWFRVFVPEARRRKNRDLEAIGKLSAEKKSCVNQMLNELELI